MKSIPRRTATNVLSVTSARLGHSASARRKYLRLAKLEFERAHRDRDIRTAKERADDGERRVEEIETEEAYLLASVEAARAGEPLPANIPRRAEASGRRDSAEFILRY